MKQDDDLNIDANLAPPMADKKPTASAPAAQPTRDPYAMGPTNYTSFDRSANSNTQASKDTANRLNNKVSAEASAANAALQQQYGSQNAPTNALRQQVSKASADRNALGSAAGIQALTGPQASGWGAAFTQAAGADKFAKTQKKYGGLDTGLAQASQNRAATEAAATQATDARQASGAVNDAYNMNQATQEGQFQEQYKAYLDKGLSENERLRGEKPMTYTQWEAANGITPLAVNNDPFAVTDDNRGY